MTERKICNNCTHQKSVGVSITCQRCFNKSLWRAMSKTMTEEKYGDSYGEKFRQYEDKIKELEAQIEKMKLCQNCKFEDSDYLEKPCCDCVRCLGDIKRNGNSDKWEIKD